VVVVSSAAKQIVVLDAGGAVTSRLPLAKPDRGPVPEGVTDPPGEAMLSDLAAAPDGTLYAGFNLANGRAFYKRKLTDPEWSVLEIARAGISTSEISYVVGVNGGNPVRFHGQTRTLRDWVVE
jgi:hypothetical protein